MNFNLAIGVGDNSTLFLMLCTPRGTDMDEVAQFSSNIQSYALTIGCSTIKVDIQPQQQTLTFCCDNDDMAKNIESFIIARLSS